MNIFSRLFKGKLKVPYVPQINDNACGAAVLEMIYKYYGLKNISQEDIFNKYREFEPRGSGNLRLSTDNLVRDAKERGFESIWDRVDTSDKINSIELLRKLTIDFKIPVIVCQKFSDEYPLIGHFRMVVCVKNNIIYVHDPHLKSGGAFIKWKADKFMDFWKKTGDNVTGGVFVIIKRKDKS